MASWRSSRRALSARLSSLSKPPSSRYGLVTEGMWGSIRRPSPPALETPACRPWRGARPVLTVSRRRSARRWSPASASLRGRGGAGRDDPGTCRAPRSRPRARPAHRGRRAPGRGSHTGPAVVAVRGGGAADVEVDAGTQRGQSPPLGGSRLPQHRQPTVTEPPDPWVDGVPGVGEPGGACDAGGAGTADPDGRV